MTAAKLNLTKIQIGVLDAARRARRDPRPACWFTEYYVLANASDKTRVALERKGLVEGYFTKDDRTCWRLTAAGLEFDAE